MGVFLVDFPTAIQVALNLSSMIEVVLDCSLNLCTSEEIQVAFYLRCAPPLLKVTGDLLHGYARVQYGGQSRWVTGPAHNE